MSKILRNTALIVPEYTAKISAIPAGILALGAQSQGVFGKIAEGYKEVITLPYDISSNVSQLSRIMNDSNLLSANEFMKKYGSVGFDAAIGQLTGALNYINQLKENATENPIETVVAGTLTAGSLWLASRALRFIRQKGQGSLVDKLERKLAGKLGW